MKVSRSGLASRIENGRRSGGSADTPALIITNWPGRASPRRLGVQEREQEVGAAEPLAADQGARSGWRASDRSYPAARVGPSAGPPRFERRRSSVTLVTRARPHARERSPGGLDRRRRARDARALPEPRAGAAPRSRGARCCACWCRGRSRERRCSRSSAWPPRPSAPARAFAPLLGRRGPFFGIFAFVALLVAAALDWSNLAAYRDALPSPRPCTRSRSRRPPSRAPRRCCSRSACTASLPRARPRAGGRAGGAGGGTRRRAAARAAAGGARRRARRPGAAGGRAARAPRGARRHRRAERRRPEPRSARPLRPWRGSRGAAPRARSRACARTRGRRSGRRCSRAATRATTAC